MKVFLHELSDQELDFDFTEQEKWVRQAIERLDESSQEFNELQGLGLKNAKAKKKLIESLGTPRAEREKATAERKAIVHFSLRRTDDVVIANGNYQTALQLICSRCACFYMFPAQNSFSALFCKDPVLAGKGDFAAAPPRSRGHSKAQPTHHDVASLHQDVDISYISSDFIDLASILTEQLQLQVPFQPLCRESCLGMCSQCGADLNVGRCACEKLRKLSPFSALKDIAN